MSQILNLLKKKRLYFDGGMGSMLQKYGLRVGELPENWNIEHPDVIEKIHREYLSSGANIITTNTFGVNSLKHDDYEKLITCAVDCAKRASVGINDTFVAFDIGPIGKFLRPIGDLDFEDAVEVFAKNVRVATACGVDLIIIETMTDSYETKAAVLAAKENSTLPIFVTNVYDEYGKTLTGSDPESMIAMLEGLGVDALGINCSLGPDKMLPLIKRYAKASSMPIICNPNAGLPTVIDGEASYSICPEEFAEYCVLLAKSGANILGGCCGTTPDYIKMLVERTKDIPLAVPQASSDTIVSSFSHTVNIGNYPILIGERINPTGKSKLKQALRENNINYILDEGLKQADAGAHILDVNVGSPEIDEAKMLPSVVCALQSICDIPLQLDSNDPKALEKAMRIYNGKPLINSVNGDAESMDAIFPLVKKYGGVVIALTLNEYGIPETPQERIAIAKTILAKAREYGIENKNIIFDPLALPIATNQDNARITLECIKELNALGYKTSLGVSNVSFGMPDREAINVSFFSDALLQGLSCAIINPSSQAMLTARQLFADLLDGKIDISEYKESIGDLCDDRSKVDMGKKESSKAIVSLKEAIVNGLTERAIEITDLLISEKDPIEIINTEIIPALNEVGGSFEKRIIYLPQLLNSAECSSKAFSIIKEHIPASEANGNSVILATVKGDIHDIGKNIVKLLLESYGFTVYDLGKDVSPEAILEAVKKYGSRLVALSALMTTTLPSMESTISLLKKHDRNLMIMVGGAVLTEEYSKMIGADFYGKDALSAVKIAASVYK